MAQALGGPVGRKSLLGVARRHGGTLALVAAGGIVVTTSLVPLLALVAALPSTGTSAWGAWASLRTWGLLGRSILMSSAITALTLAIGAPMGVLLGRTDVAGKNAAWLLHAFGMLLPPFLLALGWLHLFGRAGALGGEGTARILFSAVGVGGVLVLAFTPIVSSLVALGVMGVAPSLEDAARLSSGVWRVSTRILLPAAWPALALGGLVVFVLSFSELGVPLLLRVRVFPALVFSRLGGVDPTPGEAFGLVLPLIPMSIGLLVLERRLVGARSHAVLGRSSGPRAPLPLRRWRLPATLGCWLLALSSFAPIASLVVPALRGGGVSDAMDWAGQAPWNGLVAGAVATTIIGTLGVVIGHAVARRSAGSGWLDALSMLAFMMPAPLLGVGLISVWNRPGTQAVYGTPAILVLGFAARYAVVGIRVFACVAAQIPVHLEQAAAVAGASSLRRLIRVVLPIGARGAGFGWLLALVFCLRDLETAVLFYPPGGEPLTVRIFTLEANGPASVVAGLSVLHALMTAAVLAVGALLIRRRWGR